MYVLLAKFNLFHGSDHGRLPIEKYQGTWPHHHHHPILITNYIALLVMQSELCYVCKPKLWGLLRGLVAGTKGGLLVTLSHFPSSSKSPQAKAYRRLRETRLGLLSEYFSDTTPNGGTA